MDTPGIEVQPLRTMSGDLGENSFNQVFFKDVRVPRTNVVGKRGEGWKIANTTLRHERSSLNANVEATWLRLARLMAKETVNGVSIMASPVYRDRLLRLQARMLAMLLQAGRLGGVTDASDLMKSAGELFLELPREPAHNDPREILSLARANVAFPDFVNSGPRAIGALQALLHQIESDTIALPELPVA